jgi:hypothetical protein
MDNNVDFSNAQNIRRISEFAGIGVSVEDMALIIKSKVEVQVLDDRNRVLVSEKKTVQKKFFIVFIDVIL